MEESSPAKGYIQHESRPEAQRIEGPDWNDLRGLLTVLDAF